VLDARYGFDVAALAALSGTLKPGSFLVLLTPPLTEWAQRPDNDSCRWSDTAEPIATPRFVEHFCRALRQDENVILWSRAYQFLCLHLLRALPGMQQQARPNANRLRFWLNSPRCRRALWW
jgi:tRNA(Met) C34 N-acetyltransferase TmcA